MVVVVAVHIKLIVSYLEDNIDRICVSLVCKRWFDESDKYLYFNTDNIGIIQNQEEDGADEDSDGIFTLESYRSLIMRSLEQKSNCTLSIGRSFYQTDYTVDPSTNIDETTDIITANITTVSSNFQVLNEKYTKNLYRMISNSNVDTLKRISNLSCVLPVNLTSISFGETFNVPLLAGYLPPNLKKLKFECNPDFNQAISAGVLPNTLKKLKFGEVFNKRLEPNVLPSSLTYLELGYYYDQTLQVGSLPPNLRVLIHKGESKISSNGVLPQSLCTLRSHISWLPFIKSLNNLTTLTIFNTDETIITLNLSDLPASLTSLDVNGPCRLKSTLSPSIRYLDIFLTQYDIDEIFKDRSQYHLERLCVEGTKQESLDNLKIKELQLNFAKNKSIIRDIPFGVETLYFGYNNFHLYKNIPNGIPSSVKKLIFQYYVTISELAFEIPNTVEEVVIQGYFNLDQFSNIDSHDHPSNSEPNKDTPLYNIKCLFSLESYRSLILRSFNQKSNCTMTYGRCFYLADYSVNPCKHYRIPSLSCVLPVNLASITFTFEFNEELLAGFLPPKLEELKLESSPRFNQQISAGVLPNTLKKLIFGEFYNQALEPHVLPSSLTYLELGSHYNHPLQVGSLPPNLRVLIHYGNSKISSDGVLPQSLRTLTTSESWIPFIKSLNNLTTLTLFPNDDNLSTLDLSDLPGSLTSLDIGDSFDHLISSLSPSIRYLDIHLTDYDIDEIFEDRSQYHFETLCVEGIKQESLDNLKIKEFQLEFENSGSTFRDIPFGEETLNIGNGDKFKIEIPSSVKKIIFQYSSTFNEFIFQIPNTVEEVIYESHYLIFGQSDNHFSAAILSVHLLLFMIVNLSHILLLKIVNYLEDNLDKICVSLVCKRWFNERDKYLYFNTDHININLCKDIASSGELDEDEEEVSYDHSNNESNKDAPLYNIKCLFTLKSYRSSILRSLNQKGNCTLTYGRCFYQTDYSVNPSIYREDKMFRITPNITKVMISDKLDNNYLKEIYEMISNSNVSTLKGISSLSCVLPVNLTSISFDHRFEEPLLAGYLPPNLKKLKFEWNPNFNQPIKAGVFPNTLEKLVFGESFNQRLEPNVLPSSLTYLELGYDYSQTLQVGSLPPNLRVLIIYGNSKISSDGVLPQSLSTLESPLTWIPFIKSLNNLTTLMLFQSDDSINTIDLSDLPSSLTSLEILDSCNLKSSLSPSIRYLGIHLTEFDIDEIFKDRSQYHFERLCLDGSKEESLENLKIKELQLRFDRQEAIKKHIPFGVETLYLGHYELDYGAEIIKIEIPPSVKEIIFQYNSTITQLDFDIPNTVEEIAVQNYINSYPLSRGWIPNSVKSLTVPSEMILDILQFDTLRSVTNLCIIRDRDKWPFNLDVRKIYDNQYLIFGRSNNNFSAGMVSGNLSPFMNIALHDNSAKQNQL
ncbi:hypothetical protein PPL_08442 [Heterostelium album PN500]|uniref:Uncharacterized protein n=1 Tax=Heterostelium pallidum (strain ATCC 26659 / Pp 5 / PN500) TaxID=670386 RepID=D3BI74_HETP5|nr:hypothetical protein PPL_08442 [Heterostelium album PN500]EFA78974.1 hypothetical protein PPL_08442 [Heterostelium album PN500]|eukprot:XP_020431098.1 hypothetical protein PPL_08442 [Heterostelium album PN500]